MDTLNIVYLPLLNSKHLSLNVEHDPVHKARHLDNVRGLSLFPEVFESLFPDLVSWVQLVQGKALYVCRTWMRLLTHLLWL
jgi:hypothetical protein